MATKEGGGFVRNGNAPVQQQTQSSGDPPAKGPSTLPDPKTVQDAARQRLKQARDRD